MGKEPLFFAIYTQLRSDILSGKYPAGSLLPTEEQLTELFSASRTTVRRALSMLAEDKFTSSRQGRGTEVLPISSNPYQTTRFHDTAITTRFSAEGEACTSRSPAVIDKIAASEKVSQQLHISCGSPVFRLQRLQYIQNTPFAYITNYINPALAPNLDEKREVSGALYQFLEEEYGLQLTSGEDVINATVASFKESQFLKVEVGCPLLVFERVARCNKGILEYSEYIARPDLMHVCIPVVFPSHQTFTETDDSAAH